jgi:hypothetical protein
LITLIGVCIALLSVILAINQREIQNLIDYELYLRNLILELEKNIEYQASSGANERGLLAIRLATYSLKKGMKLNGQSGGFGLSIHLINALSIHISELTSQYKNYPEIMSRKTPLFFHSHYLTIEYLDDFLCTLKTCDLICFNVLELEKILKIVKEVKEYKKIL